MQKNSNFHFKFTSGQVFLEKVSLYIFFAYLIKTLHTKNNPRFYNTFYEPLNFSSLKLFLKILFAKEKENIMLSMCVSG